MNGALLLSVIMPAYNCERFVRQAIESVLAQDVEDFELLVADDCSKDGTKAIIDSYNDQRIKRFHNQNNRGYLEASNLLMKQARGKFVVFQDADDAAAPGRFSRLLKAFEDDPQLYAVSSDVARIDENGTLIGRSDFPMLHDDLYHHFKNYRNPIVGSSIMFRREILDAIGPYNKYFNRIGWEDHYWYSLIIQKYKVMTVKEELYLYRVNPKSVSVQNTSFRSVAGFDTCVYYLREREAGREDHILSGRWHKADETMLRFYISHRKAEGKPLSVSELLKLSPNLLATGRLYLHQARQRST